MSILVATVPRGGSRCGWVPRGVQQRLLLGGGGLFGLLHYHVLSYPHVPPVYGVTLAVTEVDFAAFWAAKYVRCLRAEF